ncbi:MAG TPA: DUF6691 family protein [Rhodospirillales bacterium]|nr:DUF6691 family protein [Rhodospirillales bacterium]
MLRILASLACGLLFGVGLTISQMINPEKVLGFLDVAAIPSGGWDTSLALVLAGAVATTLIGYRLVLRRARPLLAESFSLPTRRDIDARLIMGAVVFGAGWGLVGLCPGPALAVAGVDGVGAVVFVLAMLAGMAGHHFALVRGRVLTQAAG